tara:strand:+ start:278 stop:1924 length:1647 start_codon:yes stop_codon:yes gene_type:complete
MDDLKNDPFAGLEQEQIPIEVIIGFVEEYMPGYMTTTVEGEKFMPVLFSVLQQESGHLQFVKSGGREQSFGLFQIRWQYADGRPVHMEGISKMPGWGPQWNKPVQDMTPEEYNEFLVKITDLDFQFQYAKVLMDSGKNPFSHWRGYRNPDTGETPYKVHMPNYQQQWSLLEGKSYIDAKNNYQGPVLDDTSINPGGAVYPGEGVYEEGLGEAESNIGLQDTTNEEKWITVQKYYGPNAYDPETNTWDETSPEFNRFRQMYPTLELDAVLQNPAWTDQFMGDYAKASRGSGMYNPFTAGALTGTGTTADAIMFSIYDRFSRSLSYYSDMPASAIETTVVRYLGSPKSMSKMLQTIEYLQEKYPEMRLPEMIDYVAEVMAEGTLDAEGNFQTWGYRIPSFVAAKEEELSGLNEIIGRKVESNLLSLDLDLVDQIRNGWIDFKIANPNAQIDLATYAQQSIEMTDEYKTLFSRKPNALTNQEYISQYMTPVSAVMPAGDPNYTSILGASMALGGSTSAAGTAAFFGSPEVAMTDTYTQTVNNTAERLGKVL